MSSPMSSHFTSKISRSTNSLSIYHICCTYVVDLCPPLGRDPTLTYNAAVHCIATMSILINIHVSLLLGTG